MNVTIRGLPIFAGEVLPADSDVFCGLHSLPDFVAFAKKLRGQFSIVVEDGPRTTAITDFGCSRPVFHKRDGSIYRVSPNLADLVPYSRKRLSKEALLFYASRNGVGISPFYSDIAEIYPATVARFEGCCMETATYINWAEFLETRPIEAASAERRLIEIASEYLGAIAKARGEIACLLSGGTDSALIAWLLRSIGVKSTCLTGDYSWKRYSELPQAEAAARGLGMPLTRVLVTGSGRREAFHALNSKVQNGPCSQAQPPILYQLAASALERGISTVATGDHADALFLGFHRFFRHFPSDPEGYERAISTLDVAGKLSHLYPKPDLANDDCVLRAFGCSRAELYAWDEATYVRDRRQMSVWADLAPLHTLQQLNGQIWGGISWQNLYLPPTLALDEKVQFVSPFYDIEMLKFAMSLPASLKFRNGATKVLLRDVLIRAMGRAVVKRASPNPARIWRMGPDFCERRMQPSVLLPLYDDLFRRNLLGFGRLWAQVDKVGALGMWLSQQPLALSEPPE